MLDYRSRAESTGGSVKLQITEIRQNSARDTFVIFQTFHNY